MRITLAKCARTTLLLLVCLLCKSVAAQPGTAMPVILAIGESTTAGFGVAANQSYPAQLQALLDKNGYQYRVVNHGRSGSTTAMALASLDRGMALQPAIVLIALGGNDRGNRMAADRTRENLRKMVNLFVRSGAIVFLADRNLSADRAEADTSSLFAELAAAEGALLMPSLRQDLAGNPDLLLADMSHPNAAGYTIIANRIFELLQAHIQVAAD
jgi:acyl-CoA thioesterase I